MNSLSEVFSRQMIADTPAATDNLGKVISRFSPISLAEMDHVRLMNRSDLKFVFPVSLVSGILRSVCRDYRILEISGKRKFVYQTLYYDYEDLALYQKHQAGHLNRYKVRLRNYVDSGTSFLELKFKNNKARTIKSRIGKSPGNYGTDDRETVDFLLSHSTIDPSRLVPVIWVDYSRITLVNKLGGERLTIDLDLAFRDEAYVKNFRQMVIAEVKQEKSGDPSPFVRLMRQMHIREGGISKYCLGVISLRGHVKHNRFKPGLRVLNKLLLPHYIL